MIVTKKIYNIINKLIIKGTKFTDKSSDHISPYYISCGLYKSFRGNYICFKANTMLENGTIEDGGYNCPITFLFNFIKDFRIKIIQ